MYETRSDDESVRHLVELGYVDPDAVALRDASLRSQLEAEFQRALKLYEQSNLREARQQFERLAGEDANWVAPRQLLAEIYYRSGELSLAISQLDWLTEHAVEHPRLALISGAIALAKRDMGGAVEALEYAAYVEPTLPSVHTLLGSACLRLGRLEQAEASFGKAILENTRDPLAHDGMAAVYLRQQEYAKAANSALEALTLDMRLFRGHYHLGVALARMERPREAIAALETAAKLQPLSAAPYYWLARIAETQLAASQTSKSYRDRGRGVVRQRRESRG